MKILFAASEALPFMKVGGLGDVAGALPKALVQKGHDVRVVMPYYSGIAGKLREQCVYQSHFYFFLAWRNCYCGIFTAQSDGVTYYLIDNEQYFSRKAPYGEYDDAERFAFFSKAVLEILPHVGFYPDVIHANDWHTALVPVYLDCQYRQRKGYETIKTVFSIHNIEFQGKYGSEILGDVLGIDEKHRSLLEYDGCINFMKGAIECSNAVTTVSETYAREILDPYFSFGLHNILLKRQYKLHGIVNGIDTELFDPASDRFIEANYTFDTLEKKKEDKAALQKELGLPLREDVPVVGLVSRLTSQKGIDLFEQVHGEFLSRELQLVVLGTGYPEYENLMRYCGEAYPEKVKAVIAYSASLAQKIYAGADLFLMPSKSEPCGLAQLISLRYGTIPIVHAVGGLKDTVQAFNAETGEGNGVTFQSYNAYDMLGAVDRAIMIWKDEDTRRKILENGMSGDYSWNVSAEKYIEIYRSL